MNDSQIIDQGWFELEHRTYVEPETFEIREGDTDLAGQEAKDTEIGWYLGKPSGKPVGPFVSDQEAREADYDSDERWERDENHIERYPTRGDAVQGLDEAFKGDLMGWEYRIVEMNPLRDKVLAALKAHYDFVMHQEGFACPIEIPFELESKMYALAQEVGFEHSFMHEPIA